MNLDNSETNSLESDSRATEQADLQAMVWQVLRGAYLRVVCGYGNYDPYELREEQRSEMLDRWFPFMEKDLQAIMGICEHASSMGSQRTMNHLRDSTVESFESNELFVEAVTCAKEAAEDIRGQFMELPRHSVKR